MRKFVIYLGDRYEIRDRPKLNYVNAMINDDNVINFCVPKYIDHVKYDCSPSYAIYFMTTNFLNEFYKIIYDHYEQTKVNPRKQRINRKNKKLKK